MLNSQSGLSLTESMIALFISMSVVVISTSAALHLNHKITALQHSLQIQEEWLMLSQFITTQLQRAGYRAMSTSEIISNTLTPTLPVVIDTSRSGEVNGCVLFSYDKNNDGQWSSTSSAEHLGFRLHNQALEYRVANKGCDDSGWFDMTDPNSTLVSKFEVRISHQATDFTLLDIALHIHHKTGEAKAHHQFFVKVYHAW